MIQHVYATQKQTRRESNIVKLLPVGNIREANLHTTRMKYYLNYHYFRFAVDYFWTRQFMAPEIKREQIGNYAISYLEKWFKIGLLSGMYKFGLSSASNPLRAEPVHIDAHWDGFLSLEAEKALLDRTRASHYLKTRREQFLRVAAVAVKRKSERARSIYQQATLPKPNEVYLGEVRRLIGLSRTRGIHLIFLLPPVEPEWGVQLLLSVSRAMDTQHRIDLADPFEFPEFYTVENRFDMQHFNDQGARLYTTQLARKFNELLASRPEVAQTR